MRDPSVAMSTSLADLSACFHATQIAVMQMSADIRAGAFAQSTSSQERIARMTEINNLRATLQHLSQSIEFTARALGHLSVEASENGVAVDNGAEVLSIPAGAVAVAATPTSTGATVSSSSNRTTTTAGVIPTAGGGGVAAVSTTNSPQSSTTTSTSPPVQSAAPVAPRSNIMQPGFLNRANNTSTTASGIHNR